MNHSDGSAFPHHSAPLVFTTACSILLISAATAFACHRFRSYEIAIRSVGRVIGGYSLAAVAALDAMTHNLIVHVLAPKFNWLEALFWSSIFRFLIAFPFVLLNPNTSSSESGPLLKKEGSKEEISLQERYGMLILRGLMGTYGGFVASYWGMQFLVPSEAAALLSTAPFFALLWSYIVLGEVLSTATIVFMIVSFSGVLLVIEPTELLSLSISDLTGMDHIAGCMIVLSGGACQGVLGPMMRAFHWTAFEVVLWAGGTGVLLAAVIASIFYDDGISALWAWESEAMAESPLYAMAWLALLGSSAFVNAYLMNWAWQLEPAGPIDMVYASGFVLSVFIFQLAVLEEASDPVRMMGVAIIVAAGCGVVLSRFLFEDVSRAPGDGSRRKQEVQDVNT